MNVTKKDLAKSEMEILVELSADEFKPYIKRGAEKVSREVKIEGFRPGKAPYEVLKQKIGEMTILEAAARIAIGKTLDEVITSEIKGEPVGQPNIDITKLAPGNPLEYKVKIALLPAITLGDYKGLKIKKTKAEVGTQEVEKMLNDLREMRVKEIAADRPIKDGDKAIVDLQMYLDKVPLEGGQSQGTAVIIGKDYIVSGFDKKLIGANKGDVREFSLPYPKDFHMQNIAGKMVEFKVTVKDVFSRELPALDEKFAAGFGVRTIEELKKNIKQSIAGQKEKENKQKSEKEMLEKIMEKTKFSDLPEILVNHEVKTMLAELEQTVAGQGGKFDDYLQSLNKTRDQLTLDLLPDAVKRVKVSLLVREIASKENIKVKPEEADKQIKEIKAHYSQAGKNSPEAKEMLSKVDTPEYQKYVLNVMSSRKVVDKLWEWNKSTNSHE